MRFAAPEALWLLMLLPLLLWHWQLRRTGAGVAFSALPGPQSGRARARRALWLLRLAALALLVLALARPQLPAQAERVYREGIAIAMVLDVSSSMGALDLAVDTRTRNRLDTVKRTFEDFVRGTPGSEGRRGDLISMVIFARFADIVSPLTADHDALLELTRHIVVTTLREEDGTAIGEGIVAGLAALREASVPSRVMVLLTDGSNNAGSTPPLAAAEAARALGVRLYTIGAGTEGTAMMPARGRDGRFEFRPARVYIDEFTLTKVAEATGGRYFRATDADTLAEIYAEIDRFETARQGIETQPAWAEWASVPLLLAFLALAGELAARYSVLRAAPALEEG